MAKEARSVISRIANICRWLLKNCRKYLPVTHYMAIAQAKHEFAGTFGGILWWIGEPVLYSFIYYFVFAVIFQTKSENFIVFLLVGLVLWRWFSRTIVAASASLPKGASLMRQIDIPKIVFPIQVVITESYKFLMAFLLTCVFLIFIGGFSYQTAYIVFPILLISFVFLMGLGLVLSAIIPFLPDMKKMVVLAFQALVFISGIFFKAERIPEAYRPYFYLNPFATIIEAVRDVVLYGKVPNVQMLFLVFMLGGMLCIVGLYMHWRYNRVFPRHLI